MPNPSATIEIREVSGEEYLDTGLPIAAYAFGASPEAPDPERARRNLPFYERARNLVGFIENEAQASLVSHEMTQNLRGTVLPMGGIGAVASMPGGRRQGVVRRMFEQVFAIYRDTGVPISSLYPFRDSFYERLGYAGFQKARFLRLKPETLAPLVRHDKPGTCEQRSMEDGFDEWRGFLERFQAETHGFALKHVTNARQAIDRNEWWLALARHAGEIVGAMEFKVTGYGEKLIANTFYATDAVGRYLLLDWVGRHTDQVKEAIIELRPDEYPETWYRDLEATLTCGIDHAWPAPMGRVVDIGNLGGIAAGDGEVTVEVRDPLCPWNDGVFTFRGEGGTLSVTPTGAHPVAELTIQAVSALVFTGHDPADFRYRGWGDPDAGTQAALRAIFPPAVPDIHEKF